MPLKICSKCKIEKDAEKDFHKCAKNTDGLLGICKICYAKWRKNYAANNSSKIRDWCNAGTKRYYKKNRTAINATARLWRKDHPKESMLIQTRYRAKKKGVPFTITVNGFEIPEMCPILSVLMERGNAWTPYSPSLDEIIPGKGYVPGNVQVISAKANVMKNNASEHELLAFAGWVMETYGA